MSEFATGWTEQVSLSGLHTFGHALGRRLRDGDVVFLDGPMGAGKTTLTRALAEGLGVERPGRVSSPTYTICMIHPGPLGLVHLDLFRLGDAESGLGDAAFESLGLEHEELPGPAQVLVVEWAERWADPPPPVVHLMLDYVPDSPDVRRIRAKWVAEGRFRGL